MLRRREHIHFKPTGQSFTCKKEFDLAHEEFFTGELTEDFMHYCADQALHAFWINYRSKENKIRKEAFCQKFRELINEMLKEIQ